MIKALVAVRSGSVRIKDKNIRTFANSNLLTLKIQQLKRIRMLDGIIINSNDDSMLKIASELGCETVKRDTRYATNTVSMSDVYENMAENFNGEIVVYANATNPLIKDCTIKNAIERFLSMRNEFDSLNSAHLIKEFLFLDRKPINYDLKNQPRSQDLPNISALNFAVNILHRETMIKMKNVVGSNPDIFIIDELEATDIDSPMDFALAEYAYSTLMVATDAFERPKQ